MTQDVVYLNSENTWKRGDIYMAKSGWNDDVVFNRQQDFPSHMTPIGTFTYLRTYSRYLPELDRREVWRETVKRSTRYNVNLALKHLEKFNIPYDSEFYEKELELFRNNMYNLKQFPSGRTMWVGGAENGVADKFPLANFNCAFTNIEKWEDLAEMFYLLLVGTGVGFKSTKEMAAEMAPIRKDVAVTHRFYTGKAPHLREDDTQLGFSNDMTVATIVVGDSKEGWVDALRVFFSLLTNWHYESIREIKIDYNNIRAAGEELKTFGGTSSGHQSLQDMFSGFMKVLNNEIDPSLEPLEHVGKGYYKVRPVHILDMGNLIGYNVVVGGVRRTAEIFLADADDWESIFAKFGLNGYWKDEDFVKLNKVIVMLDELKIPYPARLKSYLVRNEEGANYGSGFHHRRMSNNSIAFVEKPKKEYLQLITEIMKLEGEPAYINLYELARRRLIQMGFKLPTVTQIKQYAKKLGINPCAEILLYSKGVCNLSTLNAMAFVEDGILDYNGLIEAQRLSARIGLRMTLVELELEEWNKVQERDRLIGTSLTRWKDMIGAVGFSVQEEEALLLDLRDAARSEADAYAKALRIPAPLLVTTVKPEGTITVVTGAGSSGLHYAFAPYHKRRVRINAHDSLAKAAREHKGWNIFAEVGTNGIQDEASLAKPEVIEQASTLVIEFPVKSDSKLLADEVSALEQLDNYFMFQNAYTEHNSSNTIRVKDHEWDAVCDKVYDNWDNFVGVSFLAFDGGTYKLTPLEECSKEVYEEMVQSMQPFDFELLRKYENRGEQDLDESCDTGVCPTR
jgi:ribonucleoside-triphosphate reductase